MTVLRLSRCWEHLSIIDFTVPKTVTPSHHRRFPGVESVFSTIAQKPMDVDVAFVPFLGTSAVPHDLHRKTVAILMYLIVILSILLKISTLLSKPR
jgi:hypothetical protein